MAEMIPIEFWAWVIPQIKKVKPSVIFIAEAYNPNEYSKFLTTGKFDFLYDKVGLYDALKRLIKNEEYADVKEITKVWKHESRNFSSKMLRFLENHDEERIASDGFAQNPWLAVPAMVVSATLSSGPVMIYFGQEVGEPGRGNEGFGGEDNRTTIFDYWGVPEHQKWMNEGAFDSDGLSENQRNLRNWYSKLLNLTTTNEAIKKGQFYELNHQDGVNNRMYIYVRFTDAERVLVVANFDRYQTLEPKIYVPGELEERLGLAGKDITFKNLLNNETFSGNIDRGIPLKVHPTDALILRF
jgi:glycosidase